MPDREVIKTYHGLWEIERSFRIAKSNLKSRPVHVSLEQRIEAHFLTCYIALLILRLLSRRLKEKYSPEPVSYTHLLPLLQKLGVEIPDDHFYGHLLHIAFDIVRVDEPFSTGRCFGSASSRNQRDELCSNMQGVYHLPSGRSGMARYSLYGHNTIHRIESFLR